MHRAPAVSFSVGRSRWHLGCVVGLSAASFGIALVFSLHQSFGDWRATAVFAAALLAPALAIRGWQKSPMGQLRWDGAHWHWSGFAATQTCHLSLLVDFQRVLLVRLSCADQPPVWLWLEATRDTMHWLPLRRAIVSSLRDGAGDASADVGELA
jgi:hypothetical protein